MESVGRILARLAEPDTKKPPPKGRRNDGLDLIRAAGAFMVVATHLYHNFGQTWLGPLAAGGYVGVYLFFPLSGYLLSRPFYRGPVDLRRYALGRFLRLAPAYYLVAAVVLVTNPVANPWPTLLVQGSIFRGDLPPVFGQAWTLGVEVAFYAVLPFLVLLPGRWLIPLIAASFVFSTFLNTRLFWFDQLPTIFWSFGLGMLVARYPLPLLARLWPIGIGLVVVGTVLAGLPAGRGDLYVATGTAILILASAVYRPALRFARWPADISYSVYLWHPLLITWVVAAGLTPILSLPLIVCVALASFVLLERPILRYGQRTVASPMSGDRPSASPVVGEPA